MPFKEESDAPPKQLAPYATTTLTAVQALFEMIPPLQQGKDILLDLGSGDGRIVNYVTERFGIPAFGVDLNKGLIEEANRVANEKGISQLVKFMEVDFVDDAFDFTLPWTNMDSSIWNGPTIITAYLTYVSFATSSYHHSIIVTSSSSG